MHVAWSNSYPGHLHYTAESQYSLWSWRRVLQFQSGERFQTFENQFLAFRFDAFNFPNHPNWSAPDSTYTSATFGKITSKTGQRSLQASLRYSF